MFLRVSGIRDSILFIAVKNVFFTDIFIFSKIVSNVDFEFLSKIFLKISDSGENLQKILQYYLYVPETSSLIELSADDFFGSRIEKSIVFTT